ncbi:MAG: M28 family metallopeptidase [Desulfitobacteriaceae bacterium]
MRLRFYLLLIVIGLLLFNPQKAYAAQISDFSSEKAYDHIKYLVQKIGPRPAGSKAEQKAAWYIKLNLEKYGWKVKEQPFSKVVVREAPLNFTEQKIELVNSQNIIAELPGSNPDCILIGAHYDSAGLDVPGAVDNASGVGLLLELARILGTEPHQETYQLVFFGAEESGLVGSSYYANQADLSAVNWMLNLDMIGLPLEIDVAAKRSTPPELIKRVTDLTRKSQISFHLSRDFIVMTRESSQGGASDFSPFLDKGLPALGLGIAGRPAGYFHRPEDGMEQISQSDLQKVGDYVKLLVTSIKLEQTGLRGWGDLYLTFQVGSRIIILPSMVIGLFILLTIGMTILILLKSRQNDSGCSWQDHLKVIGFIFITALVIVSISEIGELFWRSVKNVRVIWNAYPEYFLMARIGIALSLLILLSSLLQRLSLPRDPLIYWRIGVFGLMLISSIIALIRIDLAFPFVFWLFCFNLQFLFPNILLTLLGPYFFYKLHWELLHSQQWFSFYETLHQYFVLFVIIYALLIIPLILGTMHIVVLKVNTWRKYIILLRCPTAIVLILIILGLGLVPSYTKTYAQTVTVQEEWLGNSKGRLRIFSNDKLPQKLLDNFNAQGQNEIYLQGFNDLPPVNMNVLVTERQHSSGRLLDLIFKLDYQHEPYLLRIKIQSQQPFQVLQTEGFLPLAKLPKKVLLKGKKFGDYYYLTMESTPPHNSNIKMSLEATGQIKCQVEALLADYTRKLTLQEANLSVNYQTLVQATYDL